MNAQGFFNCLALSCLGAALGVLFGSKGLVASPLIIVFLLLWNPGKVYD